MLSLSAELLQKVLSFLPLSDRMRAGLVSRSFLAAATAATADLTLVLKNQQRMDSLQLYLGKHGAHLTSLTLKRSLFEHALDLSRLPCKHLQALRAENCTMQLDGQPGSSRQGLLHECTALTQLDFCNFEGDFRTVLSPLSALTRLQHLVLDDPGSTLPLEGLGWFPLPVGFLGHFSQLTYLNLGLELGGAVDWGALPLLRKVHITLSDLAGADLAGMRQLQQLSSLHVTAATELVFSSDVVPASVRRLNLRRVQLQPSPMCSLASLSLFEVQLPDAAALLEMLAQLQQLTSLSSIDPVCEWPAATAAYAGLTASSKLQELLLHGCEPPVGVWQHVFAHSKRLPELRRAGLWWYGMDGIAISPTPAGLQFSSGDVQRLATCCPGLVDLCIALHPDADLTPLSKLTGLTELNLEGASARGVAVLAALTGLCTLQLHSRHASLVEERWLLPLTALRQMTWLSCRPYVYQYPDGSEYCDGPELLFHHEEVSWVVGCAWLTYACHWQELACCADLCQKFLQGHLMQLPGGQLSCLNFLLPCCARGVLLFAAGRFVSTRGAVGPAAAHGNARRQHCAQHCPWLGPAVGPGTGPSARNSSWRCRTLGLLS